MNTMNKLKKASLFFLFITVSACTTPASNGQTSTTPNPTATNPPSESVFTAAEVATHKTPEDCWMIISGNVYNVTEYVKKHPGGTEILRGCGLDATQLYETKGGKEDDTHSQTSRRILETFKIGTVVN